MSEPGAPGWRPDPSGRHELRWFDGTAYSDQVADAGVQSTDPGTLPAGFAPPPGVQPPADVSGRTVSRLPLILAAVGALVVVIAVITVLGGGDGGGFGTFDGEVAGDGAGAHRISVGAGSVAVVEVEPDDDLDAIVAFVVSEDDADRLADVYEGSGFELVVGGESVRDALQVDPDDVEGLPDDPVAIFRRDSGFEGEDERTLLPVPFGVDAAVVVSGFDGDEGTYEITIESVGLDVDDDADGADLLDAVLEADDVPRGLRADLEDLAEE